MTLPDDLAHRAGVQHAGDVARSGVEARARSRARTWVLVAFLALAACAGLILYMAVHNSAQIQRLEHDKASLCDRLRPQVPAPCVTPLPHPPALPRVTARPSSPPARTTRTARPAESPRTGPPVRTPAPARPNVAPSATAPPRRPSAAPSRSPTPSQSPSPSLVCLPPPIGCVR